MLPILMLALYIGIMTDNVSGVKDLLMCFLTSCGGDLLALFNVLGVDNCLTQMLGYLVSLCFGDLVTLLIILIMTFRPSRMSMMSMSSVSSISLTFVMVTVVTHMMMSFVELLNIMTYHMR